MGVQVPRRVYAEVPQEGDVWPNPAALGHCIPRACSAQGMPDRGRAPAARPCAYADIDPADKLRNFLGHKFWARGYFVSTVGRDEETIRAYIKNQEIADKQLDQMQFKLASS